MWLIDWKLNESYIFLNEKKEPHSFVLNLLPRMLEIEISNFLTENAPDSPRKRGLTAWNPWETARALGKWPGEHQKQTKSVIREHQSRGNHKIDWEGVKILDQEMVDIKRKIKEAIHIRRQHPTLNRDEGYELPVIFNHLLLSDSFTWQQWALKPVFSLEWIHVIANSPSVRLLAARFLSET